MEWLFERMIELAAWVAFILGMVFLFDSALMLFQWTKSLADSPAPELLAQAGQAAGLFVLSSLALGCLACIDRYVFDLPQPSTK